MTLKAWRLLAIFAVSACLALTGAVTWVGLAFWQNLQHVREAGTVCLHGDGHDSVQAAMELGRLDFVSFLLTAGGILLGVFALMGFWMIRREALDEAAKVAADEARRVAQEFYAKQTPQPEQKGDKPDKLSYILGKVWPFNKPPRDRQFDPAQVSTEGAEEQLGDSDETAK